MYGWRQECESRLQERVEVEELEKRLAAIYGAVPGGAEACADLTAPRGAARCLLHRPPTLLLRGLRSGRQTMSSRCWRPRPADRYHHSAHPAAHRRRAAGAHADVRAAAAALRCRPPQSPLLPGAVQALREPLRSDGAASSGRVTEPAGAAGAPGARHARRDIGPDGAGPRSAGSGRFGPAGRGGRHCGAAAAATAACARLTTAGAQRQHR